MSAQAGESPAAPGMAERLASFDWSATSLGPIERWPEALRTAVQIIMHSRFPMLVWWGTELVNIYNDAYVPVLGKKHPECFGRPAREVWREIWDVLDAQVDLVVNRRQATWNDEMLLMMDRFGYTEETYFTWSYSPIADRAGTGLFCAVTEDTSTVIGRRRLKTLRELASETADLRTPGEIFAAVAQVLARNPQDVPFALLYESDAEAKTARLAATVGLAAGVRGAPATLSSATPDTAWRINLPVDGAQTLDDVQTRLSPAPQGPWPDPPTHALVLPLGNRPCGYMIAGLNAYKRLDDDYRAFLELAAGHIATAVENCRAYEAERRRAEALAELDRAKTLFFNNVSHEFRTPLTLMLGPLEDMLSASASDPERQAQVELIHRNGLRLLKLVNTLLDFSRIEARRAQPNFESVDLSAFTAELASSFRSAMERAGLLYTVQCDPLAQPAFVDREMWEKIVLNLLSNAFKYTLQGGVSVTLAERDGMARLRVADTGIGISEDDLPNIFQRFHRVQGARGRTDEGTGIGLALVQELVKLHGGAVSAESVPGQGSVFTVEIALSARAPRNAEAPARSTALHANAFVEEALRWLPGATPAAQPQSPPAPADIVPGTEGSHILVVDDNADMRDYVAHLLGSRYRVSRAAHGGEALAIARDDPPDLILADVMMPVLDGFDLVAAVRRSAVLRGVPVIMLSARSGEESVVEGLGAGADDYVLKPFSARELLARIGAHLALRKERQRAHARLARVFDQAPVGVAVLRGPDFVVELANPPYRALLPGRDILGRKFAEIVPQSNRDVWDAFQRVVTTGQRVEAREFHLPYDLNGDGAPEDHWLDAYYYPMREADDSISGIIAVMTDVTQHVLARKELQRANKELEEFAYVASHDLQEPLRMVNIYTQLLLMRPGLDGDGEAAQFSSFIRSGVDRMERLIKDLLLYSRVAHADAEEKRHTDLKRVVDHALHVLKMRIEETGASIARDELPVVAGDEAQLVLVFQNVLSNSMKYCEARPEVRISCEPRDDELLIRIRDNGIGFQPEHAEKIFGLFKRLHTDEYPGTGLGLAICRRVVERCGGRIWAESDGPGTGATVTIALRKPTA